MNGNTFKVCKATFKKEQRYCKNNERTPFERHCVRYVFLLFFCVHSSPGQTTDQAGRANCASGHTHTKVSSKRTKDPSLS